MKDVVYRVNLPVFHKAQHVFDIFACYVVMHYYMVSGPSTITLYKTCAGY